MKREIHYLNTDLDLVAPFDLGPLAQAISARGAFTLQVSARDDASWCATIEADADFQSPEPTIVALLAAIEELDAEARRSWAACTHREFNIGYDCGDEPWAFTNEMSSATISRMAALNVSLRITLYPAESPQANQPEPTPDAET